jgi:tetraacyldisaccharide 4'-kinase
MRKIALLPATILFWLITFIRNVFFDLGLLKSYPIPGKSISVGNLSVGGTGKTPMVSYLTALLQEDFEIQLLSRGYGRKTKGFRQINSLDNAETVGDEPLSYFQKFAPRVSVFVSESRKDAIIQMKKLNQQALIILDDAFQHRHVTPGIQLLLTPFSDPFTRDWHLPSGNLREARRGAHRADAIIVTKCPKLTDVERTKYRQSLEIYHKPIFFSSIEYGGFQNVGLPIPHMKSILLVTGISSTASLKSYLSENHQLEEVKFGDHHAFTTADIREIQRKFDTFADKEMAIVTTEKDFVKIEQLLSESDKQNYPWYVLPITFKMEEEQAFNSMIKEYVKSN